jgi:hypothetical protein
MAATYEVTLGPAAVRAMRSLRDPHDQKELADALRTELADGPNAGKEVRCDCYGNVQAAVEPCTLRGVIYTATPLSFNAYTAFHRPMTTGELRRLMREQRRPAAERGFHVIDILAAEAGFSRRQRPAG